MPHVIVKCYPGRSEELKKLLAEKITRDIAETFGVKERSISVAIQDVDPENWNTEVWDNDIGPCFDGLYRKPGYTRE